MNHSFKIQMPEYGQNIILDQEHGSRGKVEEGQMNFVVMSIKEWSILS